MILLELTNPCRDLREQWRCSLAYHQRCRSEKWGQGALRKISTISRQAASYQSSKTVKCLELSGHVQAISVIAARTPRALGIVSPPWKISSPYSNSPLNASFCAECCPFWAPCMQTRAHDTRSQRAPPLLQLHSAKPSDFQTCSKLEVQAVLLHNWCTSVSGKSASFLQMSSTISWCSVLARVLSASVPALLRECERS